MDLKIICFKIPRTKRYKPSVLKQIPFDHQGCIPRLVVCSEIGVFIPYFGTVKELHEIALICRCLDAKLCTVLKENFILRKQWGQGFGIRVLFAFWI